MSAKRQGRRRGRATVWEELSLSSWLLKNIGPLYGRKFSVSWSCQRWFNSCWVLFESSQSPRMKLSSGTRWLLAASPAIAPGTAARTHIMWINKSHHRTDPLSPCAGTPHVHCWGLRWGTYNCIDREDVALVQELMFPFFVHICIAWAELLHIKPEYPNPLMTFQTSAALVTLVAKSPLLLCISLLELRLSVVNLSLIIFGRVGLTHLICKQYVCCRHGAAV